MRRFALCLFVATVATVLASCGGDDDRADPPPPTTTTPAPESPSSERRGVVLRLDRDSLHPGETLTLTIENRTRRRLEYGVAYRLEHFVDGDWRWINRDSAFILLLKIVEPGKREREQIQLPGDVEPGRYRIVKSFTAPAVDRRFNANIEFTVANR
jgi:hypothetical protein